MEIVKQTSTQLVFRQMPSLFITIFMLVWSSGLIGIPTFMIYSMLKEVGELEFSCDRPEPQLVNCRSEKTSLFNLVPPKISKYYNVIAAESQVKEDEDSDGGRIIDYYVVLLTKDGEIPTFQDYIYVNGVRGNPEKVEKIANNLNQFLQSQQKSLTFTEKVELDANKSFKLVFYSLLILIGISAFHFMVRIVTLSLDKKGNQICQSHLSILGLWKHSYNLQDIEKVILEEGKDSDSDPYFNPMIIMRSGKKYSLVFGYERNRKTAIERANQVRSFIGLPVINS